MKSKKRLTPEEQYRLIQECRSSGLSDYQWCKDHGINPGTFYNWVARLRKKACFDIPAPFGRSNYVPQTSQEVVPLLIVDEIEPEAPIIPKVEHNTRILANAPTYAAELTHNGLSVRISNDINKELLLQIFRYMGGMSSC